MWVLQDGNYEEMMVFKKEKECFLPESGTERG